MSLTNKDLPGLYKLQKTLDDFLGQFFDIASPIGYERILPELYSLKNKIKDTIRALDTFWTYEDDYGVKDFEIYSKEEIIECVEVERIPFTIEYTHEHSDRAEHFRQSDYI